MNAKTNICVHPLPETEAWILFKRVVGERLETDADLEPIAKEVAELCGGLPLLIQVVGSTLKNKSITSWNSALSQLRKPSPSEIDHDIWKAFTRLRLSYDYLESEEAKSCFLLCSMFPEDCNIPLEVLVYYMVGLDKFDDLESIVDARDRVRNAVNMLTSSCLLLNSELGEGHTLMHDVVRDVALLISSQDINSKYLVKAGIELTEWQPRESSLKDYTGISLIDTTISKLPDYKVELPHLDIFTIHGNPDLLMISDEFIKGMKEVKVLDMGDCQIAYLPQSFKLLTNLRMLYLAGNESLHEVSIIGELKQLEILILNGTGIKEIPDEIGHLVNLRQLEVIDCKDMTRVTPGVISKLWRLEELCIDLSLISEGVCNCTAEILKLSNLTYLDLTVKSFDLIPEGFNSENLKGFVIQIGQSYHDRRRKRSDRYLVLSIEHLRIPFEKCLNKFIRGNRPITILNEIENLNKIMPTLFDEGFNKLEHIELRTCPNVSCLADDGTRCDGDEWNTDDKYFKQLKVLYLLQLYNLRVLWRCPDENISFTNLVTLNIDRCRKLVRVFTVSVAQGLINLKKLRISTCDCLEEVIYGGGGGGGDDEFPNVIVFRSLVTIDLDFLLRLKGFFSSDGNCSVEYPSLVEVKLRECRSMKIWGPGIHKTPKLKTLVVNGDVPTIVDGPFAINETVKNLWGKRQIYDPES